MRTAIIALAALALTAGCSAGGASGTSGTIPPVTANAKSRVSMSFAAAATAKKAVVTVDGQQSPPIALTNQTQTATLADNVAVSIDCQTDSSGSSSSTPATGQTCTLLTLLPPGQHEISVAQMDFLDSLVTDLSQFITLASGTDFFGNFFSASPLPVLSPTPAPAASP